MDALTRKEKIMLASLLALFIVGAGVRSYKARFVPHPLVLVPAEKPAGKKPGMSAPSKRPKAGRRRVNVNTATEKGLAALPRIGPALAREIVRTRREEGPFKNLTDLLRVPKITIGFYKKIEPYLTLE
ncbi:MAG: hypothetical protein A2902_04390 [Elusimicrobia bacterium RIFCSPLOWO2_01_FULL_64_13]|nr:MAG: hypothetical protein A2636_06055 [Elusimicrobia bacterium RIFCSPHIGHO2_01_FULL_64_10]OGR95036.1 MAG: hypothetical protein A2902_04390 [Elusimicrobia bacterium RIFCSPLOWO2_01_FULL_64_13]